MLGPSLSRVMGLAVCAIVCLGAAITVVLVRPLPSPMNLIGAILLLALAYSVVVRALVQR